MDDAQRRGMWAGRMESCLSADMTIKEWCMLNKVSESNLYRWMACFREEEPGRFPPQVQQGVRLGEGRPRRHRRRQSHRPGRRRSRERALGARRGGDPRRGGQSCPPHTRAGGPRGIGHTGGCVGARHSRGDKGGGAALNPFTMGGNLKMNIWGC